jgi:hypothetical protein
LGVAEAGAAQVIGVVVVLAGSRNPSCHCLPEQF